MDPKEEGFGGRRVTRMAGAGSLRLAAAEREGEAGMGVVDLAGRPGVDKSQASRTLRTLTDHGLVERDPRKEVVSSAGELSALLQARLAMA